MEAGHEGGGDQKLDESEALGLASERLKRHVSDQQKKRRLIHDKDVRKSQDCLTWSSRHRRARKWL